MFFFLFTLTGYYIFLLFIFLFVCFILFIFVFVLFCFFFTGYYMYIETSSPRVAGDNAKLEISVSGNGELFCLEFYYHMYGDAMGTLNVFSGDALIFSSSGNHGNHWRKAEATINLDNTVSFNPYHSYMSFQWETATVQLFFF